MPAGPVRTRSPLHGIASPHGLGDARPYDVLGVGTVPPHRIFAMSFARVYPLYVTKVERKGRTQDELDQIISWLTGYDAAGLERTLATEIDLETFFAEAPALNPNATLIKGLICGHRVEEIDDPLMQKIRYMDKLVDELARGKKMSSILRGSEA